MTTREEAVALMEWLRDVGAIGAECLDEGEEYDHHPETCRYEYEEYLTDFEILLRNDITGHVYHAIRRASRMMWWDKYGEGLDGPVMAGRCAEPFPRVEIKAFHITGASRRSKPRRRWWWPFPL